jgi:hypothetical protein
MVNDIIVFLAACALHFGLIWFCDQLPGRWPAD